MIADKIENRSSGRSVLHKWGIGFPGFTLKVQATSPLHHARYKKRYFRSRCPCPGETAVRMHLVLPPQAACSSLIEDGYIADTLSPQPHCGTVRRTSQSCHLASVNAYVWALMLAVLRDHLPTSAAQDRVSSSCVTQASRGLIPKDTTNPLVRSGQFRMSHNMISIWIPDPAARFVPEC